VRGNLIRPLGITRETGDEPCLLPFLIFWASLPAFM
jgi:hypothetical protein